MADIWDGSSLLERDLNLDTAGNDLHPGHILGIKELENLF